MTGTAGTYLDENTPQQPCPTLLENLENTFSIWAILFSFFALQGLFLTGILLTLKKGHPWANRFLACLSFLIALIAAGYVVSTSGLSRTYPYFAFLVGPFWLLLGPTLFGYMWLLTGRSIRFSWVTALQLLPFFIYLISTYHSAFFPDHFQASGYGKFIYMPRDGTLKLFPLLYMYLFTMQMMTYAVLSIRLIRHHEARYQDYAADSGTVYLSWIRRLIATFLCYMVYETIFSAILLVNRAVETHYYYISALFISTFLLLIIYTAIRDPQILLPLPTKSKKYGRSSLSESFVQDNLARLMTIMDEQRPFLRSDLKLSDLADMLDISRHHVTQLLNQEVGQSFHEFVNSYRVEEACRRISDPANKDFVLLAIAHDVGFNSKTTFNRIFKQHKRMTPSQYARKKLRA